MKAHHRPGGGFRNPWPGGEPRGLLSLLRWAVWERITKRKPAQPSHDVFPVAKPWFATPRAGADTLVITWVGHSTLLIQVGGLNILTDPIWSDVASPVPFLGPRRWVPPGVPFEKLPPIDIVLLSHNHYDHCDQPTIERLIASRPAIQWFVPLGMAKLLRRWGAAQVEELDWWQHATHDGLQFTCAPAQHFSARGLLDRDRTLWCSWAIASSARRVFFGADSGLHPEYAEIGRLLGPFDLVLLPVGAYEPRWFMRAVHMNPEDALQAYQALDVTNTRPALVPIHWGTFKLTDEPMNEPPAKTRALWQEAGHSASSLWVLAHGESRFFGSIR